MCTLYLCEFIAKVNKKTIEKKKKTICFLSYVLLIYANLLHCACFSFISFVYLTMFLCNRSSSRKIYKKRKYWTNRPSNGLLDSGAKEPIALSAGELYRGRPENVTVRWSGIVVVPACVRLWSGLWGEGPGWVWVPWFPGGAGEGDGAWVFSPREPSSVLVINGIGWGL